MSSRPITLRRLGVGAVALATVAAGLPLLVSSAANAAPATRLVITQDDGRPTAAAGTCTVFSVTPSDVFGGASDGATITVAIQEAPNSDTHDVDFCVVDGGTPFATPPRYTSANRAGASPEPAAPRNYNAGPSITTAPNDSSTPPPGSASASTNNPDGPDNRDTILTDEPGLSPNNSNPTGRDTATFTSTGQPVRFGVVGLLPGAGATVNAFVDADNDRNIDAGELAAVAKTVTFTSGGRPGTPAASNAVTSVDILEDSIAAKSDASGFAEHTFRVVLKNDRGDLVGGVNTIRLLPVSGPNAPTELSSGTFSSDCTASGNEGEPAICTYRASQVGNDSVMAFVNRSGAGATFGFDAGEVRDFATATTTAPANTTATAARNIVLTPESATIVGGQVRDFTAAVTDSAGAPVNGVSVRFDENGPGVFQAATTTTAATSTVVISTSGAGRATVRFLTTSTERGNNVIAATIATAGSQCTLQASGTAPAGNCADSSSVTITAGASPSASPTVTPSGTASPRPSTSASPRPSTSSSPNSACTTPATVSLDVTTITATGGANVTVRGTANSVIDLFAYSRPSSTYRLVRSGDVGSDGAETYRITPPTNTRLYAQQRGCTTDEPTASRVLNVRTQISLNVVRNGERNYTFSGSLLPARPNGLIASLYRVESNGRQILTAQTRANANVGQAGYDPSRPAGSYRMVRQFTGEGRFGFVVRTGQDLQNAPGSSNVRSLLVF